MGFLSQNKQNNTPAARRRHLGNMRLVILLAGGYVLYDGIRHIINNTAQTPVWFIIYLVLFAVAIVFAMLLNEKRIRVLDEKIAEDEKKAALEAGAEDEPSDLDDPN